ncbi:MAG: hypothetical protein Q8M24_15580 [Pseudolabrys sp.]|nr:hypothetical protein [Pseudolabrys sp.]MDP2296864.1 hypothetical protein [Pseudolabrys sp.]
MTFPLYMTRSTGARMCGVTDKEFARAIDAGEIAPIPSDGSAAGALYRRDDLLAWIEECERKTR